MDKTVVKLYDVVADTDLPEISVEHLPSDGDPIEINNELYFVCERDYREADVPVVGVIPLVVRNPSSVSNIEQYVRCLSMAHRKVLFKNQEGNNTDLQHSEEMIIS